MDFLHTLKETSQALLRLDTELENLFTDKVQNPDAFLDTYASMIQKRAMLIMNLPKVTKANVPENVQVILEENAYLATTYLRHKSYYAISTLLNYQSNHHSHNQLDEIIIELESKV